MIARQILAVLRRGSDVGYQRGKSSAMLPLAACVTGNGPSFYRGESWQYELCWYVTHSMGIRVHRPEWSVRFQ